MTGPSLLLKSNPTKIVAEPFDFARGAFRLRGEPIDLGRRPWLPEIYNLETTTRPSRPNGSRKSLMVFGRQSEKSTTIGNKLLTHAAMTPFLRSLYVNPSTIQVREFSDERLKAPIQESPFFRMLVKSDSGSAIAQNVNTKWFRNLSKISLRSCFLTADRIRGLAVDDLKIDEFQDILTDNLPVIEETQFHCELPDGPITTYVGTPKGFDTPLAKYWSEMSTQCEWAVKCRHCNDWNVLDHDNMGKDGLVCRRCRKDINPVYDTARWVSCGPMDAPFVGFRLPQPAVIYSYSDRPALFKSKWVDLLIKHKSYPPAQLANEVWAKSFDSGTKPITREELRRCCNPDWRGAHTPGILSTLRGTSLTWAGVDWGTGGRSTSAISIHRYTGTGMLQWAYHKRYEGFEADEEFVIGHMIDTCKQAGVTRIGADFGFGYGMNSRLRKAFPGRVYEFFYAGNQKAPVTYDGNKLTCHRSVVMNWYFTLLKRQMVSLPSWDIFLEEMLGDFTCISQEKNEQQRQIVYNHPPGTRDDLFHTGVYALLVSMFDIERPDLTAPDQVEDHWRPSLV